VLKNKMKPLSQFISNYSLAFFGIFGTLNVMSSAQAQTFQDYDWSGPYIGASLGAAHNRASFDASTSDGFVGSYFTPPDPEQIAGEADKSASRSRLSAGLFGGYGQQFDRLYLGLEAGLNSLSFDESTSSGGIYESNTTASFTNEVSVKSDWQASLRARVGWTEKRWLAYLTGGLAASRIRMDATFSDNLATGAFGSASDNDTKLGWIIGLGGEYALSESWTIRAEYLYADYGKADTTAVVTNSNYPTLANDLKSSVDLKTQILSVGVAYRF
jgi:opacity protein-like surface antigen